MAKRYIDTDEAIKAITDMPNCYNGFSDTYDKACIIGVLEELPTTDVQEVKHGHWEFISGCGYQYRCSKCFMFNARITPYCPNCGASMDGEQR